MAGIIVAAMICESEHFSLVELRSTSQTSKANWFSRPQPMYAHYAYGYIQIECRPRHFHFHMSASLPISIVANCSESLWNKHQAGKGPAGDLVSSSVVATVSRTFLCQLSATFGRSKWNLILLMFGVWNLRHHRPDLPFQFFNLGMCCAN